MTRRKREASLHIDMEFGEALSRFAQTKQREVNKLMDDHKDGLVKESDLVLPTLRLLANMPEGFMQTADLITELEALFNPMGRDAEFLDGRNDTHFTQKVRNMISHRKGANSFIANGYAKYETNAHGLRITDAGRELLSKLNG